MQFSILSLPVCIREQQDIVNGKIQKGRLSVHNTASRNSDKWETTYLLGKLLIFLQAIFSPPEWINVLHGTSVGHFLILLQKMLAWFGSFTEKN